MSCGMESTCMFYTEISYGVKLAIYVRSYTLAKTYCTLEFGSTPYSFTSASITFMCPPCAAKWMGCIPN